MRPGRIFLFLLAVVLVLSLLAILVNPEKVLNTHLLFRESVDTTSVTVSDTVELKPAADSVQTGSAPADTVPAAILYPGDAVRDSLAAGRQVRIIFYGDSQLEGDRITSRLRKLMRANGGGSGPGMISPVMPVLYTRSFVVKPSSNWTRYTLLDYKKGILPHNSLGPMLSVSRFTRVGDTPLSVSKASVRISAVPGADDAVSRYDRLRILYGNSSDTTRVSIYAGSEPVAFTVLEKGTGPFEYNTPLSSISDLTVEFSGKISPDIYALSLESDTGIVIDNIPVRGSAGLEFVMTDGKAFSETLAKLDPDLIVMQYGLNVVKNVRSEYNYYEEGLVRQIEYLREASGGVPVVLMSLTDMAQKKGDTLTTYRNIPAIRDAQRRAAERTGTVFWDAWETMGGEGSIVKWHDHVPALASKDYTHLSNAGADTIASRIYSALFIPKSVLPADEATATAETTDTAAEAEVTTAESVKAVAGTDYCCNGACDIRGEYRALRFPFPPEIQSAAVIHLYNPGILDFFPGRNGWFCPAEKEKTDVPYLAAACERILLLQGRRTLLRSAFIHKHCYIFYCHIYRQGSRQGHEEVLAYI